jgi:hypothetical protein
VNPLPPFSGIPLHFPNRNVNKESYLIQPSDPTIILLENGLISIDSLLVHEKLTFKKKVGLERGPLSLVSTTEKLLDRKVAAPV